MVLGRSVVPDFPQAAWSGGMVTIKPLTVGSAFEIRLSGRSVWLGYTLIGCPLFLPSVFLPSVPLTHVKIVDSVPKL